MLEFILNTAPCPRTTTIFWILVAIVSPAYAVDDTVEATAPSAKTRLTISSYGNTIFVQVMDEDESKRLFFHQARLIPLNRSGSIDASTKFDTDTDLLVYENRNGEQRTEIVNSLSIRRAINQIELEQAGRIRGVSDYVAFVHGPVIRSALVVSAFNRKAQPTNESEKSLAVVGMSTQTGEIQGEYSNDRGWITGWAIHPEHFIGVKMETDETIGTRNQTIFFRDGHYLVRFEGIDDTLHRKWEAPLASLRVTSDAEVAARWETNWAIKSAGGHLSEQLRPSMGFRSDRVAVLWPVANEKGMEHGKKQTIRSPSPPPSTSLEEIIDLLPKNLPQADRYFLILDVAFQHALRQGIEPFGFSERTLNNYIRSHETLEPRGTHHHSVTAMASFFKYLLKHSDSWNRNNIHSAALDVYLARLPRYSESDLKHWPPKMRATILEFNSARKAYQNKRTDWNVDQYRRAEETAIAIARQRWAHAEQIQEFIENQINFILDQDPDAKLDLFLDGLGRSLRIIDVKQREASISQQFGANSSPEYHQIEELIRSSETRANQHMKAFFAITSDMLQKRRVANTADLYYQLDFLRRDRKRQLNISGLRPSVRRQFIQRIDSIRLPTRQRAWLNCAWFFDALN